MDQKIWHDFQPLSSEIDWCETNYAMLSTVAEFWNTVSNVLFFVIPPILLHLFRQYACQIGQGVNVVWILLMVVGLGSAIFHCTLSFVGQMLDELAILWVCTAAVAIWFPSKYLPWHCGRWKFQYLLLIITVIASIAAFIEPRLNHFFLFSLGVPGIAFLAVELRRCSCPRVYKVGLTATVWFVMGILCWCSDRFLCHVWRDVIHFPYLHSAWHVLVCLGSYMACVCYAYFFAVHEAPEQCPTLKFWPHDSHTWFGIPYITLKVVAAKPIKSY